MTLICIIAKLLIIKIKHMKKIFTFLLLLSLASCAVSEGVAYETTKCIYDANCEITSIHNHVYFD